MSGVEAVSKNFRRRNLAGVLEVALHIYMHVLIAEHGLTRRVGMTAEDVELDNIQVIEFLQA